MRWVLLLSLCFVSQNIFPQKKKRALTLAKAIVLFHKSEHLFTSSVFMRSYLNSRYPFNKQLEAIFLDLVMKTGILSFSKMSKTTVDYYIRRSPTLNFILGLESFYKQRLSESIKFFNRIPANHPLSADKYFILATAKGLTRKYSQADRYYDQCRKLAEEKANKTSRESLKRYFTVIGENCVIHQARLLYEQKKFKKAIEIYTKIPKNSYLWPYTLLEKAWAYYKTGDYNRTLGLVSTYNAPIMTDYFFPEAEVLRALSYYRMCWFEETNNVASQYLSQVEKSEQLERTLRKYNESNFIKEVIRLTRKSTKEQSFVQGLMLQIKKRIRFSQDLISYLRLQKEIKSIKKMKRNALIKRVDKVLRVMFIVRGRQFNNYVRRQMFTFLNDMNKFSREMLKITIEVTARERSNLYKTIEKGGEDVVEESISRKVGSLDNVRRTKTEQLYDFDGEFWADELGDYSFSLSSNCKKQVAKK